MKFAPWQVCSNSEKKNIGPTDMQQSRGFIWHPSDYVSKQLVAFWVIQITLSNLSELLGYPCEINGCCWMVGKFVVWKQGGDAVVAAGSNSGGLCWYRLSDVTKVDKKFASLHRYLKYHKSETTVFTKYDPSLTLLELFLGKFVYLSVQWHAQIN